MRKRNLVLDPCSATNNGARTNVKQCAASPSIYPGRVDQGGFGSHPWTALRQSAPASTQHGKCTSSISLVQRVRVLDSGYNTLCSYGYPYSVGRGRLPSSKKESPTADWSFHEQATYQPTRVRRLHPPHLPTTSLRFSPSPVPFPIQSAIRTVSASPYWPSVS